MKLDEELAAFYKKSGFGDVPGKRPKTVPVYTGCMLVPLPNIETRRKFLKYHDLHHMITGYSVGRIGEGEVSAWELGTGSAFVSPTLGIMNLIALSTGLVLEPRRMWLAFRRGCRSRNLYASLTRSAIEAGQWAEIQDIRRAFLEIRPEGKLHPLRVVEFGFYALAAMGAHACLVIPAIIARFITDTIMGGSIFAAVKPRKRVDLY